MYVRVYVCMYICMYVRTYLCVCVCMYVFMYVCIYVCMYGVYNKYFGFIFLFVAQ
jgi:hypothetical protein